eukprot:COSAG02_NODE_29869_length_561_cov_1.058442_1_plen_98_part_01
MERGRAPMPVPEPAARPAFVSDSSSESDEVSEEEKVERRRAPMPEPEPAARPAWVSDSGSESDEEVWRPSAAVIALAERRAALDAMLADVESVADDMG